MAARTYQNFDLIVDDLGGGRYRSRVAASPSGDQPSADFTLPFDPTVLENLLLKLDPGRSGTRRAASDPQLQAGREFGGPLHDAVFTGDIALAWERSRDAAARNNEGVRLRLRLTGAPGIAGLPWELLYDSRTNSYLAQSERTPVVRYLEVPRPLRPLVLTGALRVLVVISAPTDHAELDVEAEWARVSAAMAPQVASGLVLLDRLPSATMSELGAWLREHEVNVLHFIGHGDYDDRLADGVLYFCDAYGRGVPVTSSVLGPYIHDHDPLRLIVLNACRSASVDSVDPFGGMAQGLVQQDAGAVVAMQFPISDKAAVAFTGEFYAALADGWPVDQAVTSARKALLANFGAEWATPTLFLRTPDGAVFDTSAAVVAAPRPPEAAPDPQVPVLQVPPPVPPVPVPLPVPPSHSPPRQVTEGESRPPAKMRLIGLVAGGALVLGGGLAAVLATGDDQPPPTPSPTITSTSVTPTPTQTPTPTPSPPPRAAVPGPTVGAEALASPVTVDGLDGDWAAGAPRYDTRTVIVPAGSRPTATSSWRIGWDREALHLFVEVVDAEITQTHAAELSQLFKGDSVSFEIGRFVDPAPTGALPPGDLHVLFGPTPDGRVLRTANIARRADFVAGPAFTAGEAAVVVTSDGYDLEASIPWSALGLPEPAAGDRFAMNLVLADAVREGDKVGQLHRMSTNNPGRTTNSVSRRFAWGVLEIRPAAGA